MRRGSVAEFDAHSGLGAVRDEDTSTSYRFHCTQIAGGSRHIDPGVAVTYRLVPGRGGSWEAAEVTPRG